MAYIGKEPIVGNFQKCDAITVVNGQAAYTLQVSSVNVTPESANHMLVSLNGILQAPTTSFTVSGSTLTFASNLITGDVIDFVMLLGNVLDLGVPSDATVSTAKIVDGAVTSAKLSAGKVLQVVQTVKTTDFSASLATDTVTDITGLSASITPSSSSNKILVSYNIMVHTTSGSGKIQLMRDSTKICINTSTSGFEAQTSMAHNDAVFAMTGTSMSFLDSPSTTSSITYKPQLSHASGLTKTVYVNTPESPSSRHGRFTSQITLMEIKA